MAQACCSTNTHWTSWFCLGFLVVLSLLLLFSFIFEARFQPGLEPATFLPCLQSAGILGLFPLYPAHPRLEDLEQKKPNKQKIKQKATTDLMTNYINVDMKPGTGQ